jgi:hypothetical protein
MLREIAAELGTTVAVLDELRRASGFPPSDPDDRAFTDGDLVQFRSFVEASTFFSRDELLDLTQVIPRPRRAVVAGPEAGIAAPG